MDDGTRRTFEFEIEVTRRRRVKVPADTLLEAQGYMDRLDAADSMLFNSGDREYSLTWNAEHGDGAEKSLSYRPTGRSEAVPRSECMPLPRFVTGREEDGGRNL